QPHACRQAESGKLANLGQNSWCAPRCGGTLAAGGTPAAGRVTGLRQGKGRFSRFSLPCLPSPPYPTPPPPPSPRPPRPPPPPPPGGLGRAPPPAAEPPSPAPSRPDAGDGRPAAPGRAPARQPPPETAQRGRVIWVYLIPVVLFHLLLPLACVPWLFSWTGLL